MKLDMSSSNKKTIRCPYACKYANMVEWHKSAMPLTFKSIQYQGNFRNHMGMEGKDASVRSLPTFLNYQLNCIGMQQEKKMMITNAKIGINLN